MIQIRKLLTLIVLPLTVISCKQGSKGDETLLPNVTGSAGEVVLVLPNQLLNDSVGVAYKKLLTADVPFLPQAEPMFNLITIPPDAFNSIMKSHRNIIYNEIKSNSPAKLILKYDVWAAPQSVLFVIGPDYKTIEKIVKEKGDKIVAIFEQAERKRTIQTAIKYEESEIAPVLEEKFNVRMHIPKGYKINFKRNNMVWISHETPRISQGLIIYSFPFKDKNTFTADYLIAKRDSFVKNIEGPTKGSYMTTSMVIPPQLTPMMYKDRYYAVLRGLWDVYKHPMGGPFISYATVDEKYNRVIVAEAYVYAPDSKKRNLLRQVEALILDMEVIDKNTPAK
ncbi:MAG: DUF4837 family protein [Bacteroidales bacterium]|nr:DUF4837 family protein [Bacteroidales bacterium]HPD96424.1 DUF4837 family protein [Tenuifilaceae bacterium]HRX32543.1 DUF4837 family protein [Tenuifilaceae bacterium]